MTMIAGTVYRKEKTPILHINFSSLSVLVPPLFIKVLTYDHNDVHIKLFSMSFIDQVTLKREMKPPSRKTVPTERKMQSGARTKYLSADMSQTPTEHTPLNTSPVCIHKKKKKKRKNK